MQFSSSLSVTRLTILAAFLCGPTAALAQSLGSAESFSVLGGGAVTCTDSAITWDVGAGSMVTRTSCLISEGTVHENDAAALDAYADFLAAYETLASTPCDDFLAGPLSGVTLRPGVYCFDGAAALTGTLTLEGPAKATWLFLVGTSGTGALTATNLDVVMAGGAQACNVTWRITEAATLTTSTFQGIVLAGADVTVTGGTVDGDVFAGGAGSNIAPSGALTLTNTVIAGCEAGQPGDGNGSGDRNGNGRVCTGDQHGRGHGLGQGCGNETAHDRSNK